MLEELLEAWRTNERINLRLIETISSEGMRCTLSKRGGRDVSRQFAHLHNVRVWQMQKRAKDLSEKLEVFETAHHPSKEELTQAFADSARAIETFLTGVLAGEKGRRGFKKGIFTTLAYFVAHESHHRGNILATLKECGHKIDKKTAYAIWGWDQI